MRRWLHELQRCTYRLEKEGTVLATLLNGLSCVDWCFSAVRTMHKRAVEALQVQPHRAAVWATAAGPAGAAFAVRDRVSHDLAGTFVDTRLCFYSFIFPRLPDSIYLCLVFKPDPLCTSFGDCCPNYSSACGGSGGPTPTPSGSCFGACGGQGSGGGCFCDAGCTSFNDVRIVYRKGVLSWRLCSTVCRVWTGVSVLPGLCASLREHSNTFGIVRGQLRWKQRNMLLRFDEKDFSPLFLFSSLPDSIR